MMNIVTSYRGLRLLLCNSFMAIVILFFLLSFQSCDSHDDQVSDVTFFINMSGFSLETEGFGNLKSSNQDIFSDFTHKYGPATLLFISPEGVEYSFNTGSDVVSDFGITLPVGSYTLSGSSEISEELSQNNMSFLIPQQTIIIEASTTKIEVSINPNSILVIIADELQLLDRAYFEDDSNLFFKDGIFEYSYLKSQVTIMANIVKNDSTKLEILIGEGNFRHVYKIIVTTEGLSELLIQDPDVVYSGAYTEYRGQLPNGTIVDARNGVWSFENGWIATPKNTAKNVYWVGGEFYLTVDDQIYSPTDAWEEIWHHNGGWTIKYNNVNWVFDRVSVKHVGDGFNISEGTEFFTIKNSYISDIRDDAVQNDDMYSGNVTNNFFDGVYVGFSARQWETPRDGGGSETWTIQRNLIWIKPMYSVFKGDSPGNGQLIKWQENAPHLAPHLVFKNNIVRMGKMPFQSTTSSGESFYFPPNGEFDNNVLVWDGEQAVPQSLRQWFNSSHNSRIGTMDDWDKAVDDWYLEHPYFVRD